MSVYLRFASYLHHFYNFSQLYFSIMIANFHILSYSKAKSGHD